MLMPKQMDAWIQQIRTLEDTLFQQHKEYYNKPSDKLRRTIIQTARTLNQTRDAAYQMFLSTRN